MARPSLGAVASRSYDAATFSDTPFSQIAPVQKTDVGVKVTISDTMPAFWDRNTQGPVQTTDWGDGAFSQKVRVLGGGSLTRSSDSFYGGVLKTNGSNIQDPYELEFWHPGDTLTIRVVVFETNGSDIRTFVDDVPTERVTRNIPAAGTYYITFESYSGGVLTPYLKKIRVSMGRAMLVSMAWTAPWRVPRATQPKKAVAVTGDTYSVGSFVTTGAGNIFEGTWMHQLKAAGLEVCPLAQPATGYVNTGANNTAVSTALGPSNTSHFGSTSRLAAMLALYNKGVRDLIVFGGTHDGAVANATIQAAAIAFFAAVATQMPQMRIYVIGVQPVINSGVDVAGTNTAIKNAVALSPNALVFIDQRVSPAWITGTGNVGSTRNNGNADYMIAANNFDLTKEGAEYIGTLALEALGNARTTPV